MVVFQEDASDCGRACGLVRPTVLSVLILTALTLAVTVVVVGGRGGSHWPTVAQEVADVGTRAITSRPRHCQLHWTARVPRPRGILPWRRTNRCGYTVVTLLLPRDAMLVRCMLLSVRPSVCLFVTGRYCTKMAEHWITQTTPYDSPRTL